MMMTFLKKLGGNLFTILAVFGMIYSSIVVAEKYFGEPLYGILAFIILMLLYFVTERSWHEAKREYDV